MRTRFSRQSKVYIGTEIIYGISMGIYSFVLNLFFLSIGIDIQKIGVISSIGVLVMGISALPLGFLTRHIGRKNMYAGGVLLIGFSILLYVFSPNKWIMIPAISIAIGMTMVEVSEVQVMYQCCKDDTERVAIFSTAFAAFVLGNAVGTFFAGHLSEWMGGYRCALFVSGIITLVVGIIRWNFLIPDRGTVLVKGSDGIPKVSFRDFFDRRFLGFLIVVAVHGAMGNMIVPFSNLILKCQSGWRDGPISAVLTISPIFGFFIALVTPTIQRKKYSTSTYMIVYCMLIFNYLALVLCKNIFVFMLLFILRYGLEIIIKNMIDSVAYLILDDQQKDIYAGARSLTKGIAGAGMALIVGGLLDQGKVYYVFCAAAGLMACAALLFVTFITPLLNIRKSKEVYL